MDGPWIWIIIYCSPGELKIKTVAAHDVVEAIKISNIETRLIISVACNGRSI